jgi:hypothetical protein
VPDHHDAQLIVQLAQWGTALGVNEAITAVMSDDFDVQAASADEPHVRSLLYYFETIGTLTKNRILDQALVLDWLWAAGVWARVGPAAVRERERHGEPALYENFEALAAAQRA